MKRGFSQIIIVAVIVGILVGAGATFAYFQFKSKPAPQLPPVSQSSPISKISPSPTVSPDETASWKTYSNTRLGYSIKYPQNWNVFSFKDYPYSGYPGVLDPTATIITSYQKFPKFQADGQNDPYSGIDISLGDNRNIGEVLKIAEKPDAAGNTTKFEKLAIGSITAYKETRSASPSYYSILIPYPTKPGVIFIGKSSGYSQDQQLFDQILSTFRFI